MYHPRPGSAFLAGTVHGCCRFIPITVSDENKGVSPSTLLAFGLNVLHQKLYPPAEATGGPKGSSCFGAVGHAEKQQNWVGKGVHSHREGHQRSTENGYRRKEHGV